MRKQNHHVSVWLTDREHDCLKQLSETTSLKMEPLLRKLVMGEARRARPPDIYPALLRELSAIGNSVNQIAHAANGSKPDMELVKTDAQTGAPPAGVTFTVRKADSATFTTVTTNAEGKAMVERLETGVYEVTEESVPSGYLLDTEPQMITLVPGRTAQVRFRNYPKPTLTVSKVDSIAKDPIKGAKFQITKKSADDSPMNGLPAGTLLPGATFEIYTRSGRRVDTVKTGSNGVAISRTLPLGRYTVRETVAPTYYAATTQTFDAEIEFSGQIVRLEVTNSSVYTNVSVQKRGYVQVVPGQTIRYEFKSTANFRDFRRPEQALRYFIRFVAAKTAVTYGMDIMTTLFTICAGIIGTVAGNLGNLTGAAVTMVWSYLAETIFNMLVLVGLVKGADRIIKIRDACAIN